MPFQKRIALEKEWVANSQGRIDGEQSVIKLASFTDI